jgi:N-acetylneuraminate synthase
LRAITYLNQKFPWPAGFSSPARNESLDIAALTLGAAYIEKRLVLEDSERAFHAHESLTPTELKVWMESIRQVEAALGSATIEPSTADLIGKTKYYKSLCTLQDVREGDIFGPSNLGVKRPGTGIPASNLRSFFGKYAKRSINANTLITQADAE